MDIGHYSDIADFYDADDRRRRSREHEFGNQWHDAAGHRYKLSWVDETGELYLQRMDADGSAERPSVLEFVGDLAADAGLWMLMDAVIP